MVRSGMLLAAATTMNNIKNRGFAVILLVGLIAAAGIAMAQDKYKKAAARGPYRVFLTKPIVGLGIKVGKLCREHELLGAAMNDLDRKGYVPIWTEVFTSELEGLPRQEQLLLICRKR